MSEIVMTSTQTPAKKRDAILAYRAANPKATANEIVKALGVNLQYVYSVFRGKKKTKAKGKIGRPRKVQASPLSVAAPKETKGISYQEYDALRSELMQATHLLQQRLQEINELTVIIAYLEHRCSKAEGHNGVAV